jgi:hypothetical protein
MMQNIPVNIASIPGPGGRFGLCWSVDPDKDIQTWHLVRCDYPITQMNASGLLSGGLDLMLTRYELHPSCSCVLEDSNIDGKHYVVIGLDAEGVLHIPDGLSIDPSQEGRPLSGETALSGWLQSAGKKDRHSNVF